MINFLTLFSYITPFQILLSYPNSKQLYSNYIKNTQFLLLLTNKTNQHQQLQIKNHKKTTKTIQYSPQ